MRDRETMQALYIRICRDSGFGLDAVRAAIVTATVIGCHPLEVWLAMPSMDVMTAIADGSHPAARA